MFFIICALSAEARPLISALSLRKDTHACPYETYFAEDSSCVLVLSGTGTVAAASGATYLLTRFGFRKDKDFLINFGSCAGSAPGLFLINRITDEISGRDLYPDLLYDLSACGLSLSSEKALHTVSHVVSSLPDPSLLYDMEASGIFQAASRFAPPHRVLFLKYVTDAGTDDQKKITASHLTACAEEYVPSVCKILEHLGNVSEEEPDIDEDLFISAALSLRASETMRHELWQLFIYARAEGIDIGRILSEMEAEGKIPVRSKRDGKEVLDEIRERLI